MRIKFDTTSDVKRALSYIANKVLAGEIDTKTANCIAYLSNAALAAIRVSGAELAADMQADTLARATALLGTVESVIDKK